MIFHDFLNAGRCKLVVIRGEGAVRAKRRAPLAPTIFSQWEGTQQALHATVHLCSRPAVSKEPSQTMNRRSESFDNPHRLTSFTNSNTNRSVEPIISIEHGPGDKPTVSLLKLTRCFFLVWLAARCRRMQRFRDTRRKAQGVRPDPIERPTSSSHGECRNRKRSRCHPNRLDYSPILVDLVDRDSTYYILIFYHYFNNYYHYY